MFLASVSTRHVHKCYSFTHHQMVTTGAMRPNIVYTPLWMRQVSLRCTQRHLGATFYSSALCAKCHLPFWLLPDSLQPCGTDQWLWVILLLLVILLWVILLLVILLWVILLLLGILLQDICCGSYCCSLHCCGSYYCWSYYGWGKNIFLVRMGIFR